MTNHMKKRPHSLLLPIICILIILSIQPLLYNTSKSSNTLDPRTIIYVNDDNTNGPWDGTKDHPYQYIQDAIDTSTNYDTIHVYTGTYQENLNIDKTLTIHGLPHEPTTSHEPFTENNPIINGNNQGSSIKITQKNCTITGFTIKNGYTGIHIHNTTKALITENEIIHNNRYGIWITKSTKNTITQNIIQANEETGIEIEFNSYENIISHNTITLNEFRGINIEWSYQNLIGNNTINENTNEGIFLCSNNDIVFNNSITTNRYGIYLFKNKNTTLQYNTIINPTKNLELEDCTNITIQHNEIHSGITIINGWRNHTITNNTAQGKPILFYKNTHSNITPPLNTGQILLTNCSHITIQNLNISNVEKGMQVAFSKDITITRNSLTDCQDDHIFLYHTENSTIKKNIMTSSQNLGIGIKLHDSTNILVHNNQLIELNTGIILHKSDQNQIFNNVISNNIEGGIFVNYANSTLNQINENQIIGNEKGIELWYNANHNTLKNNIIFQNAIGVLLHGADKNTISQNKIESNQKGIYILPSSFPPNSTMNNLIIGNNITANENGVYITSLGYEVSNNHHIYHNNFIDNTQQAFDICTNNWHNSSLHQGNYWSDYTGKDTDNDGIGDQPYQVEGGNNQDHYPLIHPWNQHGDNHPPTANNDTVTVNEDSSNNTISVLDNDVDPDQDPLTITSISQPIQGTARLKNNNIFYTPQPDYYGNDTFIYTISDNKNGFDTGTIHITVLNINDPPNSIKKLTGPDIGYINTCYEFITQTIDPDEDPISYLFDWDDTNTPKWTPFYTSGKNVSILHSWQLPGTYQIRIKTRDIQFTESLWSKPFTITIINETPNLTATVESGFSYKSISIQLSNNGNLPIENISIHIDITKTFVLTSKKKENITYEIIYPHEEKEITIHPIRGYGLLNINVTLNAQSYNAIHYQKQGIIFAGIIWLPK